MISAQQSRSAGAMVVMLAVLVWAQAGLATVPGSGHGPQCHGQMSAVHSKAHAMSAGCCPRHASSMQACPSHPKQAFILAYRSDCCSISNRPSQPVAFVVTPRVMQPGIHVSASPALAAFLIDRGTRPDQAPRFIQSIFDKKADLRI